MCTWDELLFCTRVRKNCLFLLLNHTKQLPPVQLQGGWKLPWKMLGLTPPFLGLTLLEALQSQQHLELVLRPVIYSKQQTGTLSLYSSSYSLGSAINNTVDVWDWAFWYIILRMAKTTSVVVSYSGLYEGDVEHINCPHPPPIIKEELIKGQRKWHMWWLI